ncbi:hypothetical protein KDA23_01245 [Candidatus Saccharibacteria bacterium]|nr:hypothetical protein [Candidatus Saccharibacteria bacterium]
MFGNNDNNSKDDWMSNPPSDAVVGDAAAPAPPVDEHKEEAPAEHAATPSAPAPSNGNADDLLDIKQNALRQLTPLVGHLDQTPEEKFRTTMMMIQASDNKDLVKDAYDAAQAITDDKARAQALLDIVNEINYFTQQN